MASEVSPTTSANAQLNPTPQTNANLQQTIENPESKFTKDFGIIPIPKHLQYDMEKPFRFGILMNISFGFASTFVVANLYYCQPLLSMLCVSSFGQGKGIRYQLSVQLSLSFGVTYNRVSRMPTLVQAGYAAGLLLISPLGDIVRRRQLTLSLVIASTALTVGVALTHNLIVFETLSFMVGAASVTPQILIPLVADLAPPERRASALSVVLSGLLFGVLIARVLAGVIANVVTWRVVYYFAIGVQLVVLVGSYFILPDYPSKNTGLNYWDILKTMAKFAVTEPILIQACLITIGNSACFSSFWVTLTFLLGAPPYNYSTLVIGLFGLIGIFGVAIGPFFGRLIDHLMPWYAILISLLFLLCFQSVQTAAGGINVAAVIIATIGLDVFRQMCHVSLTTTVLSISASARSRLNAVLILWLFVGQVMGTSIGTQVFVNFGWRAAAGLSMGWYTWFGYEGGLEARKTVVEERKRARREDSAAQRDCGNLNEISDESQDTRGQTQRNGASCTVSQRDGNEKVEEEGQRRSSNLKAEV